MVTLCANLQLSDRLDGIGLVSGNLNLIVSDFPMRLADPDITWNYRNCKGENVERWTFVLSRIHMWSVPYHVQ